MLRGCAEIAKVAQDQPQAVMGGRRVGIDRKGTAIARGGGFGRVAEPVNVSQSDVRLFRLRRQTDRLGEMGQCPIKVSFLTAQRTQKTMCTRVRRIMRQNAFARGTRPGNITPVLKRAPSLQLRSRDALTFRRAPGATPPQHLFEYRE